MSNKPAHFRSRARVIDLLGRQQIADVPTAIGELFKNALDAGARNVWADYQPEAGILTIRDDGLGMRQQDVLDKWLVLATESKHKPTDDGWARFADDKQKKWLKESSYGEKGIGRLSVASLGRMVLLWTVWGDGTEKRGTLCLVHWHLFQHPLKLFEDLPIPYMELKACPTEQDVAALFSELAKSSTLQELLSDKPNEFWPKTLRDELKGDVNQSVSDLFPKMSFFWDSGTSFFIFGTAPEVSDLFAEKLDDGDSARPEYLKAFHAFATFWDPFHKNTTREFSVHPLVSGKPLKRTNKENKFWEPSDFQQCDHHIRIEVSKEGFASGEITNFRKEPLMYSRQLTELPKSYKSPGIFLVEVGYVQGLASDSRLPKDVHAEMDKRLERAGGFSIYLNNVRVQPYGARDSDFAGFEHRRLKNAGRYYFSMLRMFGGVFFLPDKEKTALREKAGREGFIVNGASKGLRFWLENLFVDIADHYLGRKANREDKLEKREAKERKAAMARLEQTKSEYIRGIPYARGWLRDFSESIKPQVRQARQIIASETNATPGRFLDECQKSLAGLRQRLSELQNSLGEPPEGVVIDGDASIGIGDYLAKRIIETRNLTNEITKLASQLQALMLRANQIEKQERIVSERMISSERAFHEKISVILAPAKTKALSLDADLAEVEQKAVAELDVCRRKILGRLSAKEIAKDKSGGAAKTLEEAIQKQTELFDQEIGPRLRTLSDEILHLTDEAGGRFMVADQAEELSRLRERQSFLVDMAQLGLVFETANHEHEEQVKVVRQGIRQLRAQLGNEQIRTLAAISDAFDIIDERIRMFDPLLRRRSAEYESITGVEIEEFLLRRFEASIKGLSITTEFTEAFCKTKWLRVKRPNFLGAIHNLFLNATYWCQQGANKRRIRLSEANQGLVVSDSGPGIVVQDAERIFEPGFSRRPGGRGLGLYIARESLHGMGYELIRPEVPALGALEGANFIISQKEDSRNA
ncbi:MAG: ATP-binding protein [Puniceicoccales bacterium]|jgi:signal transduction histidine kinase|nr:ATP-binding protein [Puniceicoccales bacterium]